MASESERGKPSSADDRHMYGPRNLSAVLPALVRPILRKKAPGVALLISDWEAAIGPALAAVTVPRKLAAGTLTVACAGPVAMELQYLAPQLLSRINAYLGGTPVARLRFVQDLRPPPPMPPERKPATEAAKAAVQGMKAGELRDALERLGRMVLR
jgi:hypothetical protein